MVKQKLAELLLIWPPSNKRHFTEMRKPFDTDKEFAAASRISAEAVKRWRMKNNMLTKQGMVSFNAAMLSTNAHPLPLLSEDEISEIFNGRRFS